ncbi:hypothetical protein HanIR_Chr03g0102071 [Helianthus annuus]|nr:hypothetical protein HanIR_Chr03g0102071 [Helianthus annuus]
MITKRAQSKIRHFQITFIIQQQVFGLQISVIHTTTMTKINSRYQLLKITPSNLFPQPPFRNLTKQLTASNKLHSEIYLGFTRHHLIQLNNIRMLHHFHNRNLSFDLIRHSDLNNLFFSNNFHSYVCTRMQVFRMVHFCKCTMPELAPQLVLAV